MIGLLLAGGNGTRLRPLTITSSKQLLPVYDKPMVYYPLATLMLAGIREVVIITTPHDLESYKKLLGDGSDLGMTLHYKVQDEPKGLAQAFLLTENFIHNKSSCLILGDNIFHGTALGTSLSRFQDRPGCQIFGYQVANPSEYGVVEFGKDGRV